MEYKGLLKEYFDNLGISGVDSDQMRVGRIDFINTLKSMYGKTKFPKKTYCEEFNETKDIEEIFDNTTLITGLTTGLPATQITGGELIVNTATIMTYENSLNDLSIIELNLTVITPSGLPTISISIDNQLGENLYNSGDTAINAGGTFTFTPGLSGKCNFIVSITIDPDASASVNVQDITFTFQKKSIILPSDVIVPLRVIFTSMEGREFASTEILLEEYIAWTPFHFTDPDGSITVVTDPIERYTTRENFLYDRAVGYLFYPTPSGITLKWNPPIKGKVTLVYSSLPIFNISEGQMDTAIEAFSDCLVAGATFRGLRRRLANLDKNTGNDVIFNSLVASMRDYKAEHKERMADFIEFTKARATVAIIEGFDYCNDSDMLRS